MALDKATIRNLELTETLYDKRTDGSLLGVLDRTDTAMGGRKLKLWQNRQRRMLLKQELLLRRRLRKTVERVPSRTQHS